MASTSSGSLSILHSELQQLCIEVRSDTYNSRNKAIDRLDVILSNRKSDLIELISNAEYAKSLNWNTLFINAFEAVIKHAIKIEESKHMKSLSTLKNKICLFSGVVIKVIEHAVEAKTPIKCNAIIDAVLDGFGNPIVYEHFGNLLCQIIERGLIVTNGCLVGAKTQNLSALLKQCLASFDQEAGNEQNLPLLRCTNNILDLGTKYSLLCIELPDYLEFLRHACNFSVRVDTAVQCELIKLVYQFVVNVSVDRHTEVANLLRTVMPSICGYYDFRMKIPLKEQFFELCAIFIDIHYLQTENFETIVPIDNKEAWKTQLKQIFNFVKMEVKEKSREFNNDKADVYSKHFLALAVSISHLIFWDPLFESTSDEIQRKIAKYSTKFQGLLDLAIISENSFNWGWFIVLSECMTKYSHLTDITDYQPMLQALVKFQKVAQSTTQVRSVAKYCKALLKKEPEFEGNNFLSVDFCKNRWKEVTETALNQLLQKTRHSDEQQILVQLLIESKKIPNESLLSLIRSLITNSAFRTDTCLNTIRLTLKYYGEVFLTSSETVTNLLNWLYPLTVRLDAKSMMNDKAINPKLAAFVVSQLIVENQETDEHFMLYSSDESKSTNLEIIHTALNFNCLKKIVFIESQSNASNIKEQTGKLSKLLVNEEYFKILLKAIDFDPQTIAQQDATDLINNLSKIEIILALLSTFARRGIFDKNDLCLSAVIKKAGFLLNAIEFQLGETDIKLLDVAYIKDILNKFESVLGILNEPVLRALIRNDGNQTIVEFLCKGSAWYKRVLCDDGDTVYRRKLALKFIKVLSLCDMSQESFSYIDDFKVDFDDLDEVESILSIIEVFCKQKTQPYISQWILNNIRTICRKHHENLNISLALIKLLPAIAKYIKPYPESNEDIIIILSSFLKKSYNKTYPANFVGNLLVTVRNIAKIYPEQIEREEFVQVYGSINKFLKMPCKLIQYAAVDCWSHLINDKWLFEDSDVIPFRHVGLCDILFDVIDQLDLDVSNPSYQRQYPVAMQLLLSAFGLSYYLEEKGMAQLIAHGFLTKEDSRQLLQQITKHLDRDVELVLNNYVIPVVMDWFSRTESNDVLRNPPWSPFVEDELKFLFANRKIIQFCALCTNYDLTRRISNRLNTNLQEELKNTLPICWSILIPKFCKTDLQLSMYGCSTEKLVANMKKAKLSPELLECKTDSLWEVFYHLIKNVWDPLKFIELCGFKMKWPKKNVIDFKKFELYITHLVTKLFTNSKAMFDLVMKQNPLQIVYLLTAVKTDLENSYYVEMKLFNLFHYCLLIHCIVASFNSEFEKEKPSRVRGYLIRDSFCYLCNILKTSNENILIYETVSHFLCVLCELLLPRHAGFVGNSLNLITRTLICTSNKNATTVLTENCLKTLNLLMCKNSNILSKSIVLLDDFPTDEVFSNFRQIHEQIKYSNQSHSLLDEVNNFVQVENRGTAGFQNIRNCLCNKKDELIAACNFQNKTIEEIRASPIFKLLKLLLSTIKSKNNETQVEAAKCLGELGPVNLTTVALYSDFKESCYENFLTDEEAFKHFVSKVLHALESILMTGNHKKLKLANEICRDLVNSEVGKKCLASIPLLHIFGESFDNNLNAWKPCGQIPFAEAIDLTEQSSYNLWIAQFTSKIYAWIGNKSVEKLAASDSYFSEQTFVAFFKFILSTNDEKYLKSIEKMIERFFEKTYQALRNKGQVQNAKVYTDKSTIKYFLNVVECIRIHNQFSSQKLKINYLHVAEACLYCEAYFMAVISLEMFALLEETQQSQDGVLENESFSSIARKAFSSIGCVDAVNGFLNPVNSRLEYYSLQNRWDAVLLEFDAYSTANSEFQGCLKQNGFYTLASNIETNHRDYEVMWRLGNWDIRKSDMKLSSFEAQGDLEKQFQTYHYFALKAVKRMDEENAIYALNAARQVVVDVLNLASSECALNIYKYITWLQMLQQIEDFSEIQFPKSSELTNVFRKWNQISNMDYDCFDYKELALSQKIALFDIAGIRAQRKIKEFYKEQNIVGEHLLSLIGECKASGNRNLTIRNIAKMRSLDISAELKVRAAIEDADINWKMGNAALAKSILHEVAKKETYAFCFKRVDILRIYGEYLAESNSESFSTIYKKFFRDSMKLLDNFTAKKDQIAKTRPVVLTDYAKYYHNSRKNIYKTMAQYADREYNQVVTHINSEDFQLKIDLMGKNKNAAIAIRAEKQFKTNRDNQCTYQILANSAGIDNNEIQAIEQKRVEYLLLAIDNYIEYCILDESIKTMEIYRMISLWFSNKDVTEVSGLINTKIASVPSYKFLCVLNQMSARLGGSDAEFDSVLQQLLVRCSLEHPHHTLPYILAMAHANLDISILSDITATRLDVAKKIIDRVCAHSDACDILDQMRKSSKALIEFANKVCKENTHNTLSSTLQRMKDLDKVQCHTLELPISVNKEYSSKITSISKWKEKFTLVGGINAPKKITCLCSDGIARPQLLKGKDDLRQDAIMQQIFGIVNDVLVENKDTRKRKLKIRTYKVVPFSMRSGILEWCENTLPLGSYLVGEKKVGGAHKKYRPNDWSAARSIKCLQDKHKESPQERYAAYKEVCSNVKPVFHHFFFEFFLSPELWFEKRLAYMNSVATNSIVGYILGLGDRHLQNILIDKTSAEVVHIDFGIAFEQGKVMPTPETVPFRLTRDIVAPFGVCGVEGIFRKSCEKTMNVLRQNVGVLATVLEVLLYDPLYNWIVKAGSNNEQVECETNLDKEEKNATAHRALIRVKAKLMGMEDVGSGINSVEGQVQRLIRDAMDPRNLCLLFPPWSPHI